MPAKSARIAIATTGKRGLEDHVSGHFGHAKTFTIVEVEDGKVKNVQVIQNPAASLSRGIGRTVAQHLADLGVGTVVSGEVGPGASIALDQLGMKKLVVNRDQRVIGVLRENDMATEVGR